MPFSCDHKMRLVDLRPLHKLELPRNNGELTRALTEMVVDLGASRFGYIEIPHAPDLMRFGVRPRLLTNFPSYLIDNYVEQAKEPFSQVIRAIQEDRPHFSRDALLVEEEYFWLESKKVGYVDGLICPIPHARAAFCYAFDRIDYSRWPMAHYESELGSIAAKLHWAACRHNSIVPPFTVPGYTQRIRRIFELKANGRTNEEIGRMLKIRPESVKKAIGRFCQRLGGISTYEAIYHLTKMDLL